MSYDSYTEGLSDLIYYKIKLFSSFIDFFYQNCSFKSMICDQTGKDLSFLRKKVGGLSGLTNQSNTYNVSDKEKK